MLLHHHSLALAQGFPSSHSQTAMVDSPTTTTQPSSSSSSSSTKQHHSPTEAELKATYFSFFFFFFTSRKKTTAFAYGFMVAFLAFTIFLVFYPSWYSSPSFKKIFHSSLYSSPSSSSYGSHFSSIFSHLLPNASHNQDILQTHDDAFSPLTNTTFQLSGKNPIPGKREGVDGSSESMSAVDRNGSSNGSLSSFSDAPRFSQENGNLEGNIQSSSSSPSVYPPILSLSQESNQTENWNRSSQSSLEDSEKDILGLKKIEKDGFTFRKNTVSLSEKQGKQRETEMMNACNLFDGRWVIDDANYPLYPPGSCPHIDQPFNCFLNNRPDNEYEKYRWQPKGCNIPRLNGQDMLELLRGKRLVFVGDSLNRNMWESLVCVLRNSMEDLTGVFEASGRREFRTEGSYSFIFKDYNCSVEFFRSPFLVQEWEIPNMDGSKKETLRLDVTERSLDKYISADILIFNTGHWWTHEKTAKGRGYYQEGNHVYGELNVKVAFRKALTTWARWVDANIDPRKTLVFFRGYSSSHFRAGRWNSGGQCDGETEPIMNEAYLRKYPAKMRILESVIKGMKTPIFYLNITRMTDFRKDAHPSFYRKKNLTKKEKKLRMRHQDCSHWCLPGVPDTWNELLYAQLLILKQKQQHQE